MTMADIWLTDAARAALKELPSRQAHAVNAAIRHIPDEPGRPLHFLPGAPPSAPFLAAEPEESDAPVVIYRRATPEENGDWLVVSLMAPADYHAARGAEQRLAAASPAVREGVASAVQDSVSPADQLIRALRQLLAQARAVQAGHHSEAIDLDLMNKLIGAQAIFSRWAADRFPRSAPPGSSPKETADYVRKAADVAKQDEELAGALQAISRSRFSVDTIENAIRVVERQAWAAERL